MSTYAASNAQATVNQASVAESGVNLASLGNMLLGLIFVVLVIFLLAYLAKRFKLAAANQGQIQIQSVTSLGTKEKVVIIEYQNKRYLLGVTAHQINLLDKLVTDEDLENEFSKTLAKTQEMQ